MDPKGPQTNLRNKVHDQLQLQSNQISFLKMAYLIKKSISLSLESVTKAE